MHEAPEITEGAIVTSVKEKLGWTDED